ncbi:hypothetical protein M8R20_00915 [Pseudomonas sp. R2.Fl]|nr:hypothetical protein [Pseudomonas sp. R2.Fl]
MRRMRTVMDVFSGAALALMSVTSVLGAVALPAPAHAVVYCKAVGVPKGCVVRPAPVVVYCTRPGYPVGCVARPTATAVYCTRPGYPVGCLPGPAGRPMNRGGPVNRVGVR